MRVISKETYKVVRYILENAKFTQYEISKKEEITFSLVNKVVNWLVSQGYVAKRKGHYDLISAGSVFNLFPLYRKMKPYAILDVNISKERLMEMIKGKGSLCLTSALEYYDAYYRDPAVYLYLEDKKTVEELKSLRKGYTHIEIFNEDLNKDDFVTKKGQKITNKIRTIIDLFCANKAYSAERLIKKEWS